MTKQREMGRVARIMSKEMKVMKCAHKPGPSSQLAGKYYTEIIGDSKVWKVLSGNDAKIM